MRWSDARLLGLRIAFASPDWFAEPLRDALAPRISVTYGEGEGDAEVMYELREGLTNLEVVRLDASSCELIDTTDTVDRAAELIANDVHRWVAEHHAELLLVHAGAVEWRGAGIVMPGRSRAGKSSLTAALIEAGAAYLSDEFAPLDREGNIHPYPRHLSFRDGDGRSRLLPAANFSARVATEPVPIRYVVDAPYVPGTSFKPKKVSGTGPLMALADNALTARSRPNHTLAILSRLTQHVIVLRSNRGDAALAARTILDTVDADQQLGR